MASEVLVKDEMNFVSTNVDIDGGSLEEPVR